MSINQEKQNNLQEWLKSINSFESFTQNDILNGMLIYNIILNISPESASSIKEFTNSMTTLSRVTNWNILTEQLKKFNIIISQEQKSKIIGGNQEIVIEIVSKLKEFYLRKENSSEVDLTQIDPKKNINEAKSLLEILLISMMKNFHLSAKEAVALLSNESKYLAHILTKGLKGEFKGIENFLNEMKKYLKKVIEFCQSNPENIIFFLRSIKPALISKSETVSLICLQFFNQFLSCYSVNERMEIFQTHLQSTYLLTTKRHPAMENQVIFYIFEVIFQDIKNEEKLKSNEFSISKEEKSIHQEKIFKDVFNNDGEKYFMVISVIKTFNEENKLKDLLEVPFLSKLIEQSIEGIKEKETSQICIDIVILMCQLIPELFFTQEDDEEERGFNNMNPREMSLNLLESLKSVTFSENLIPFSVKLFTVLQYFGQNKHFIAPNIYKLILEKFSEIEDTKNELYQIYLLNFMETIKEFPSIPWNPILDNILARKKNSEDDEIKEVELDFFLFLLEHSNIDIKNALLIFDCASKLFIETYHLGGYLIKIMIKVIDLFSRTEPIVEELTSKLIKVCLAIHHANTKKFSHKRKSLTGNTKTTDEEALMKIKNLSIEFFFFKVAELHVDEINSKIKPLIAFNYIQMKEKEEYVKGFQKTLEIFGNFPEIIERYETEIKKAEEEAKELQKIEKLSKEKEKEREKLSQSKIITKAHSRSRYEQDYDSAKKLDTNYYEPSNEYKAQSFSMHVRPLNGSYLGITPSAQKGIEKFQKVYLEKIEKQDLEKMKKQEEEEKLEMMKKIYKKKMVSQYGIDIKGETDQIQYLFEFDSLEGIDEKTIPKVSFYTNETEEDRDMLACEKLLKTYQKPLKVVYSMYSGQKRGQVPQNFDEIAEKNVFISSSSLFKFLKDFGFEDYISLREVQQLSQKINIEANPSTTDYQTLGFEGFIEFIKQVSFLMFTRPPKDLRGQPLAMMLEETFSNLKLFAAENKINEQIFEEPNSIYFNEIEAIAELNRKLSKNPDYILPEGYKKIVDKKINFEYGIFLEAMSLNYKIVFEVVDELLFNALGIHVMEPFTREEKITRARPALFVAERLKIDTMSARHIPVSLKKEIMRVPIKSRTEAKECAIVIDDIITAIELGHDEIGQKHMNKVEAERKKQINEEIRKFEEEKRRRENRNRQAKSVISQYKEKLEEREKEKSIKKQEEEKRIKEEKERKEKEAEDLKKKIDEYNKKKKEEEEEKLKKKKELEEREKKERDRFKQLNEETKKKIEEEKKKKEEQENIKKAEKEAEEKRIKEIEKKKLMESQIIKKKMVEEFKLRKSQIRNVGSALNKSINSETNKSSHETNKTFNKELKNLESYGDEYNESRINE